jgi:hypothetical protein
VKRSPRAWSWAALMHRAFGIDVLATGRLTATVCLAEHVAQAGSLDPQKVADVHCGIGSLLRRSAS